MIRRALLTPLSTCRGAVHNVLDTYIWQAVDHRTTRVVRQWFAAQGVEPGLIESLAEQDLRTMVAEDVRLVESAQRGSESGGYRPAPLVINPAGGVNSEHSILALYEWLGEAMAQGSPPPVNQLSAMVPAPQLRDWGSR